jgi:hypothetical protein
VSDDLLTRSTYWPLGTVVIAGPKVLDFYAGFCAHRATCLKADGRDIRVLNLILSGNSDGASETDPLKSEFTRFPGPEAGGEIDRCGILIYTASPGAKGTLGCLVATAPRLRVSPETLERLRICSNDPVCADHKPDEKSGDRATHGAACHGCLLIAETSCEMRNLFLDRSLLVPTMTDNLLCFF